MLFRKMWWTTPSVFVFGFCFNFVYTADQHQCRVEFNIQGMALQGFVFKKFSPIARGPHECDVRCEREVTCQSYNYVLTTKTCELNNRTKEARPENFFPDPARFYIRRLNNRGMELNFTPLNTIIYCITLIITVTKLESIESK